MPYNPLTDERFIAEIALDRAGGLLALISAEADFNPNFDASNLEPLIGIMEHAAHAIPIDDSFDKTDPHVRGPYDIGQFNAFYRDSGLEDVVTPYWDEDEYAYYIFINTD